jgi:hypothetical protein
MISIGRILSAVMAAIYAKPPLHTKTYPGPYRIDVTITDDIVHIQLVLGDECDKVHFDLTVDEAESLAQLVNSAIVTLQSQSKPSELGWDKVGT